MGENEKKFGVPKVDSTPMGIINMEGNFYRGLANSNVGKPVWIRVCAILFSLYILVPGLGALCAAIFSFFYSYKENYPPMIITGLVALFVGVLLTGVSVKIIMANLRKSK